MRIHLERAGPDLADPLSDAESVRRGRSFAGSDQQGRLTSILVSHPHAAAVANATAVALDRHGKLGLYVTGIIAGQSTALGRLLHFLSPLGPVWRNRVLDIHRKSLRSLYPIEAAARLVALAAETIGLGNPSLYDSIFVAHDEAVARLSWSNDIT